jgi:hypothetical protein
VCVLGGIFDPKISIKGPELRRMDSLEMDKSQTYGDYVFVGFAIRGRDLGPLYTMAVQAERGHGIEWPNFVESPKYCSEDT